MSSEFQLTQRDSDTDSSYKGRDILKTNSFFKDLIGIMNNDEFISFYNKYFENWSDTETIIFFMKLYSTIKYEYFNRYKTKISDELMVSVLHDIMTIKDMRKSAMNAFKEYKVSAESSREFRGLLNFHV